MPAPVDNPPTVLLSDEERESGVLSDVHMYDAIAGFTRDGVVVLQNAIPVEIIDKLNTRMTRDTEKLLAEGVKEDLWNSGAEGGNLSQVPPMEKEYMFPEIYANRVAGAVLTNLMGPRPELRYVRSNTLVGNIGERQEVHKDVKGQHLNAFSTIAANLCLVDVAPENGSTELWLGTHTTPGFDHYVDPMLKKGAVKRESSEARRKIRPPVQPQISRGSLVLRDLRLWHAGMPNHTSEIRVMLALVYTASWYKNHLMVPYPKSLQSTIESLGAINGTYLPASYYDETTVDYLDGRYDGDFRSTLEVQS